MVKKVFGERERVLVREQLSGNPSMSTLHSSSPVFQHKQPCKSSGSASAKRSTNTCMSRSKTGLAKFAWVPSRAKMQAVDGYSDLTKQKASCQQARQFLPSITVWAS